MNVDRENRDRLVRAIERFASDDTTSFEFDEEIFGIADHSSDELVKEAAGCLWLLYDDEKDHPINWSREVWGYVQRIVLLLKSDVPVELIVSRRWSATQLLALAGLLGFAGYIQWLGFGRQLLAVTPVLWLFSLSISALRSKEAATEAKHWIVLAPFESIAQLARVRRRVPSFRKRRFRDEIAGRRNRSGFSEFGARANFYALWILFSPLVLLFQALPPRDAKLRIVTDGEASPLAGPILPAGGAR